MRAPHGKLHAWVRARDHNGQVCRACGAARTIENIHRECSVQKKQVVIKPMPDVRDDREPWTRVVTIDDKSNPPMWYAWPFSCPMIAEKVAAGHPKPMACVGGHIDANGTRQRFAACWHTERELLDVDAKTVGCKYNPETDLWNRPLARIHPDHFQPQELPPLQ